MPGVRGIFTGNDLDLSPQIPFGVDSGFARPLLGDHVRYVGDPSRSWSPAAR